MNSTSNNVAADSSPPQDFSVRVAVTSKDAKHKRGLKIPEGRVVRIGRSARDGCESIPWDLLISRQHADMVWENGRLRVTCLTDARNPIVYQKESAREVLLEPGESFRIGTTTFHLDPAAKGSARVEQQEFEATSADSRLFDDYQSFSSHDLRGVQFKNTDQQLELLSQLPGLISNAQSDTDLSRTICGMLLDAIPNAQAVAVAQYETARLPELADANNDLPRPTVMRVQTREGFTENFQPSRNMIIKTLRHQESVLHVWGGEDATQAYTAVEGLTWAVCAPIKGESSTGWCMYVSGKGSKGGGWTVSDADMASDLRFTELVAQFIASVRQVRFLQEQKTKLNSFFSPKVIDSVTSNNGAATLAPAERNITVLFCDIRGFSRKAEGLQDDLFTLLKSVRAALGVMVGGILDRDGTIADFQGDAAMGFWGWPVALDYGPIPACRAAIAIQKEFQKAAEKPGSLLEGFSVGIGVAHGRAIAGEIGTEQQSKIGVFGPVVNQCSRLEGMTKRFGVSICIDQATAEFVDRYLPADEGRLRPLARVCPEGMQSTVDVYNLLPSEDDFPSVTSQMIKSQIRGYEAMIEGRWDDARAAFSRLPEDDGPRIFLLPQVEAFRTSPPKNWNGTLTLVGK